MKKLFYLLFVLFLSVSLASCNDGVNDDGNGDEPNEPDVGDCRHKDADDNGKCDECDDAFEDGRDVSSNGLEFELNENGTGYALTGIGDCTESEIIIGTYNGLPVTSIQDGALYFCDNLTGVTIGNSVTSIGGDVFIGCESLASITVDENNTTYKSIDGNLYSKDGKSLIQYAKGKADTSFTVPDGVTSIGNGAFSFCKNLAAITIPDGVTSIGDSAFSGCEGLADITIPDSVTSIGNGAFYICKSLAAITIPDGVTSIEDNAFSTCLGLVSVSLPNSLTTIANYAFYGCQSLTSITVPDSVTGIGDRAFAHCIRLSSIYYTGTEGKWNAIEKGTDWDSKAGEYTVICNYTKE